MKKLFATFIILCLGLLSIHSQSVSELKKRKANAMKQLEITNNLISETSKNKAANLNLLNILNAQIKEQQKLINTINSEVKSIDKELTTLREETNHIQQRLDDLKAEYAKLMYHSYFKKGKLDNLLFILSADNFTQSYRRWRYLKEYSQYCEKKGVEIQETKVQLDAKLQQVENKRLERLETLQAQKSERTKLKEQQKKQDQLVADLQKKEKSLKAELKKQQQLANKLNKQIEDKIAAEAKKSVSKAGKDNTYTLTKEEKLVSGNFEKNKGRLPWPVEKGILTGSFGKQAHPVLKHVSVDNKGVYIQCPKGTKARAVFDGEVTQVFSIPGSNNAVIIKHGAYRTVYANLTKVYVKAGDKVKPKQDIGIIYTDTDDGNKTELYFQVWKDKQLQNPELWLSH